jgi:hypothetical protein
MSWWILAKRAYIREHPHRHGRTTRTSLCYYEIPFCDDDHISMHCISQFQEFVLHTNSHVILSIHIKSSFFILIIRHNQRIYAYSHLH